MTRDENPGNARKQRREEREGEAQVHPPDRRRLGPCRTMQIALGDLAVTELGEQVQLRCGSATATRGGPYTATHFPSSAAAGR